MIRANELNQLLQKLQFETPNCGGAYYFWKMDLEYSGDVLETVRHYLNAPDLVLAKVPDFGIHLQQRLHYWSNHRTSLDCREGVTEQYASLETEFKEKVSAFLEQEQLLGAYVISNDAIYSFGEDHVNDDTLIQTAGAFYVLHFGWSS